jgi:hypothetical protein
MSPFVDRSRTAVDGSIVLGLLAGEFTVKRSREKGARILLQPENPAFANIEVNENSASKLGRYREVDPYLCRASFSKAGVVSSLPAWLPAWNRHPQRVWAASSLAARRGFWFPQPYAGALSVPSDEFDPSIP